MSYWSVLTVSCNLGANTTLLYQWRAECRTLTQKTSKSLRLLLLEAKATTEKTQLRSVSVFFRLMSEDICAAYTKPRLVMKTNISLRKHTSGNYHRLASTAHELHSTISPHGLTTPNPIRNCCVHSRSSRFQIWENNHAIYGGTEASFRIEPLDFSWCFSALWTHR